MYDNLTPPDQPVCPECKGTGYFEDPITLCDECPYPGRDCKECIKANGHIVDYGQRCELCWGNGYVTQDEYNEYILDRYTNH